MRVATGRATKVLLNGAAGVCRNAAIQRLMAAKCVSWRNEAEPDGTPGRVAMQKVEGSSPFIRFTRSPR
jgi:hypothetical protein